MINKNHKIRVLTTLLPGSSSRRIVVLTGARQTGKTTTVKEFYPELHYVNLDSPENRDTLRELSTAAWSTTVGNAVIDEAQKEPGIFEKVKYAYDESSVSFTVLTGSSQILLLKKIRESLAGRAYFYELWPLMQCELVLPAAAGKAVLPLLDRLIAADSVASTLDNVPPVILDEQDHRLQQAENYIEQWGGMPALLPMPADQRWLWLKNYGYTYLERDVTDLARLDDLMPFRKFQRLAGLRSALLLNYSELARDAGTSVDTARRYLEYLNLSYQTVLLQPYFENLTSAVVKTPKLYWTDIGILRQLTGFKGPSSGPLYETMVVGEIFKWIRTSQRDCTPYFYRTRSGLEVDLLLETAGGLIRMEIKNRATVAGKDLRPLREIAAALGRRWMGGLVVYRGKQISRVGEPNIWAIPSRRLLQP